MSVGFDGTFLEEMNDKISMGIFFHNLSLRNRRSAIGSERRLLSVICPSELNLLFERADRGLRHAPTLLKQRMNEKMSMGWIGTADKSERT